MGAATNAVGGSIASVTSKEVEKAKKKVEREAERKARLEAWNEYAAETNKNSTWDADQAKKREEDRQREAAEEEAKRRAEEEAKRRAEEEERKRIEAEKQAYQDQIDKSNQQTGEANALAAAEQEQAARNQYIQNINSGLTGASASNVADYATGTVNPGSFYSNLKNLDVGTQADWTSKKSMAEGAYQSARNTRAGAFLNGIGAFFGGAGQGAQTGASIGGWDGQS